MTDLFAARSQMAMSLAFHILFAVAGIGMPLLMVIAESFYARTKDPIYLELAKRWSKGTAIMFAVGAVSGTVLSFELGLLWPRFMEFAGPIVGMPFSLEGFAFFLEAIFLGIYLYGWDRIPQRAHLFAGFLVLLCGALSSVFVVSANAWMNTPSGFTLVDGKVASIDPYEAMMNPAMLTQSVHMTLSAFLIIGFAVAGIHAYVLTKRPGNRFHRKAFAISLLVASIALPTMWLSGDRSAKHVAEYQPIKLASMEGQWDDEAGAPIRIFGWPDKKTETTKYAIEIPYMLSFLAYGDPNAIVKGLKSYPKELWPPVWPVHVAFQLMIGSASFMALVVLIGVYLRLRRRVLSDTRWYLWLVVLCAPLGFVALEAGWTVTEVGRQPWVIYNIMKTADAVTPMPNLVIPFVSFTLLYFFLGIIVAFLLKSQVFSSFEIGSTTVSGETR